ncbi:MAG: CBS domain-containing protein [Verrucomicrobia bacterium]|nr:CBS domain-containing protein [Verrucomicrobiota bacterium]
MPDQNTPDPPKVAVPSLKSLTDEVSGPLHPDDSVQTAGIRMRDHDTSKWPVSQDRKLVGMINKKNPDWEMGRHGHDPKAWKVGQIMSDDVVFCYEDEECSRAQRLMEEHVLSYLAVVDREMRIVGIFSRAEIQALAQSASPETSPENAQS